MTPQSYLHQRPDWPNLHWRAADLIDLLADVRHRQGRLLGRMEGWGFAVRQAMSGAMLTDDVAKSSEIEGEMLNSAQIRSSIARRIGIGYGGIKPLRRDDEGVVEMQVDATVHYDQPLDACRLFRWHSGLFPTGRSNMRNISVGGWRTADGDPMQVVSGPVGREKVHFEAPSASRLDREMSAFLDWLNEPPESDALLKAGMAHLWFVTIHPFDDGNGRIARAITDLLLARADGASQRFYSMSSQIRLERADYYRKLESSQKGTTDITSWMEWFLACLGRAIINTESNFDEVLAKAKFWAGMSGIAINDRQNNMINQMLDGFRGKLTVSKWATISKCSLDEARQDIAFLIDNDILARDPVSGREPGYHLVLPTVAIDS